MSSAPHPPSSDAQAGPDPDLLAALSPSTPPLEQQRIAAERPDLHAVLAANPDAYPELLEWLRTLEDPAVQAALANRAPAQPAAAPVAGARPGPAPAAGAPLTPAPPRRRAPMLIGAAVVVVLVLAGAGWGVWTLLGRGGGSSSATSTVQEVSAGWAEASHKVWKLDVDEDAVIAVNGDQLVVGTRNSSFDLTRVTAYDVSGSEPKEQWETRVNQDDGYVSYWGDWVYLGGSQLLKASDGAPAEAGWDEDDFPTFIGSYALVCDKHDHCTGWSASDPTTPLWEQDIAGSASSMDLARYNWAVHDGSLVTLAAQDTAVRLEDGTLVDLKANSTEENVIPLADGWLIINYVDEEYRVLSPSGEQVDAFEGAWPSYDEKTDARLFEAPRPTGAQMRALVVDGDLSWAAVTSQYDPDEKDHCSITLTIGERRLVPARDDGECVYGVESSWYALSSDGSLLMHVEGSPSQTSASVALSGMWSVADGRPVAFAGSEPGEQPMWLVNPGLIITFDREHGQLTAYAPGKK